MCDEMRCEVFPHSVGTCVKDSSRGGRERTADAVLGRSEARAVEKGEQRKALLRSPLLYIISAHSTKALVVGEEHLGMKSVKRTSCKTRSEI